MASGGIVDSQISASSQLDGGHSAAQARLHFRADGSKSGGWSALTNDDNQWLEVDVGSYTRMTSVATQGRNSKNEWVTRYNLQYSDDGISFHMYVQSGEKSTKVRGKNCLRFSIVASAHSRMTATQQKMKFRSRLLRELLCF